MEIILQMIRSDSPITVSGEGLSQSYLNQFTYYVNQTREMDDFIKALTEKLSDYPEDVMVIAYGDHLPGMNLEIKISRMIQSTRHRILSGIILDITRQTKRKNPVK